MTKLEKIKEMVYELTKDELWELGSTIWSIANYLEYKEKMGRKAG